MTEKQTHRQWIVARRPVGDVRDGDLVFRTDAIPRPAAGEVLLRNQWLSLDPAGRVYMSDVKQYLPPIPLGDPMRGFVCGTVVESTEPGMPVGTVAMGFGTWAEYSRIPAAQLMPVPELPGMTVKDAFGQGFIVAPTAYLGLRNIGAPRAGETLVVSAAAGAVGSLAGQIGKVWGCKVVGIAGGAEKCEWLVRDLGFDGAVDYRQPDLENRLREACPQGIDVFFDNVGGSVLDTVLGQMNVLGRVVQCGVLSTMSENLAGTTLKNYGCVVTQRLRVQGFIVVDWFDQYPETLRDIAALHAQGRLKWRYHDVEGLENAESAFRLLFKGANHGKLIVRL